MKNNRVTWAAAGAMVLMLSPWVAVQTSSGQTEKESTAAMSTTQKDSPPRKIVVGSLMYAMYRDYPGLEKRLQTLSAFIDDMAQQSRQKYGVGLDLVALPEVAVNGGRAGSAAEIAEPLQGPVLEIMGAAARKNKTYVIVPLFLADDASKKKVYNACILLDRQGKVAGIYRKVYVVADDANVLEGGALPGKDFPVFPCDFGKLGIQICFDMSYDAGWETLARKGAELVVWSTQSPQIIGAQCRSHEHHYYLLTSTWRNNATLVDPTGAVIAQTTKPSSVLVEQVDLSYVLLDWQVKLENGKALADKYGKAVGFRYSEAEDGGIFWSNDPKIPVMKMVREQGLELSGDCVSRNRRLQDEARGGPPSAE
ncbi:MAG: carbon-nitrogen hydrolase family protein [Candidatus Brocadiia bacterium]